jgi:hypothetical protein
VFALRLNRRKLAENPIDSIRCKFSIDAAFAILIGAGKRPPFRNHTGPVLETGRSPSASNEPSAAGENPAPMGCFGAGWRALAFA